jgi:ribose transport system substrate-binding protein
MRRIIILSVCLLALLGSHACKKQAEQGKPAAKKKLTIAVIPKGTTHEFWKSIHAGAVKASQELNVDIIWKGPLKEDDREAQIKVVEDFITRGVDAMVLAPLDDTALREPVANAAHSNIPVVIIDSGLKSEDFISFVATDNYKGGHMAGEYLCKLLNGKGKVIMLRYEEGSASTMERERGWSDAIKDCKDIQVVSDNQYGGATTETSYQAGENLLSRLKNPDGSLSIDGIFCPNESTTFGMLRTLQEGGWAGKVKFVGFDSSAKLIEALSDGQINGLILQNPFQMGYLGVKTAVAYLNKQPIEKRVDTGETLVTKENMDQPEIKELLAPDLKKWLNE